MSKADDKDFVSILMELVRASKLPFLTLWIPTFIFLTWAKFTSSSSIPGTIFGILAVIVTPLWIVSLAKIDSSTTYRIVKKRNIPEERKEEINVDWHKLRRGDSRWQEFIETKLDHYNFSSPINNLIDELVYSSYYSQKTVTSLKLDITVDRLKKNQDLYRYFIDDYYDEFERKWEEKTLATVEPEIDEGTIERRRRRLEEHLAEDKVLREGNKEYLRDTLREAKEMHREYLANKKAIEQLNIPEDLKEEVQEELEDRYEDIREDEEEEAEEKEDRW